jgi:hypothetical protein
MTTLTFNTLKYANRLKSAGLPDKQADEAALALAEVMGDISEMSDLVTKQYLDLKIAEIKAETKSQIAESEARLIKWVVSAGILQTAIITTLVLRIVPS